MFKFVSKALLTLVMDKKARKKLQTLRDTKNDPPPNAAPTGPPAPPTGNRKMTPEREEVIRQATAVHRAQSKLLDHLSEEDRERLHYIALRELRLAHDKNRG